MLRLRGLWGRMYLSTFVGPACPPLYRNGICNCVPTGLQLECWESYLQLGIPKADANRT